MKTADNYNAWNVRTKGTLEDVVAYGLLAPSSHNTQPWQFVIEGDYIKILPDYSRSLPYSDRYNRAFFTTLGCAWANCEVAAVRLGYAVMSEILPEDEIDDVTIQMRCVKGTKSYNKETLDLFNAITKRQTNRRPHIQKVLDKKTIDACVKQVYEKDMTIHILTDEHSRSELADMAAEVAAFVYDDPVFKKELQEWLRPTTTKEKDGIALFDAGVPAEVTELIVKNIVNAKPNEEAERDRALINASTGFLILTSPEDTREAWLKAGRLAEYCWLMLTNAGVSVAPMTGLVEHPSVHQKLMKLLKSTQRPLFFARIGYTEELNHVSPRRPLEDVLKRSL